MAMSSKERRGQTAAWQASYQRRLNRGADWLLEFEAESTPAEPTKPTNKKKKERNKVPTSKPTPTDPGLTSTEPGPTPWNLLSFTIWQNFGHSESMPAHQPLASSPPYLMAFYESEAIVKGLGELRPR